MSTAPASDPRHTITPDSFTVAPELLGLPLARPGRRLGAMLVDLLGIALLANAGGVFLAIAAAIMLWRASSPGGREGVLRGSVRGTLRVAALVLVLISVPRAWNSLSGRLSRSSTPPPAVRVEAAREPIAAGDSAVFLYAEALRRGDADAAAAILADVQEALAGDRIRGLERERDRLRRSRDAEDGGVLRFLRGILDDLGIGFGWGALYFTGLTTLWRGQTLGKRVFGLRVIRLDAKPIGWWIAFERFGGYAASLSTGLLGFVQILWDRNRQGLHDKAVETVVIRDIVILDSSGRVLAHRQDGAPREAR
jgi:uncharacterized RDD family membrane protein YckC